MADQLLQLESDEEMHVYRTSIRRWKNITINSEEDYLKLLKSLNVVEEIEAYERGNITETMCIRKKLSRWEESKLLAVCYLYRPIEHTLALKVQQEKGFQILWYRIIQQKMVFCEKKKIMIKNTRIRK